MNGGIPERTIERSRGCFNCLHFRTGKEAEEKFANKTGLHSTDLGLVAIGNLKRNPTTNAKINEWRRKGLSEYQALERTLKPEVERLQRQYGMAPQVLMAIQSGDVGFCGVNAVAADFIAKGDICGDSVGLMCKWTGKSGYSAAGSAAGRAGMPIDELRDVVDHDAKLRTRGDKK